MPEIDQSYFKTILVLTNFSILAWQRLTRKIIAIQFMYYHPHQCRIYILWGILVWGSVHNSLMSFIFVLCFHELTNENREMLQKINPIEWLIIADRGFGWCSGYGAWYMIERSWFWDQRQPIFSNYHTLVTFQ